MFRRHILPSYLGYTTQEDHSLNLDIPQCSYKLVGSFSRVLVYLVSLGS